ncbi:MAG: hypothetical protein J5676_14215 [Bacteroidaceae bacterium]|nr:hypothetical protein [Bacteroidaceae bacterium]
MKKNTTLGRLLIVTIVSAFFAVDGLCQTKPNMLDFDYSQIFDLRNPLGYIGKNYQRLYMYFDTIYKDTNDASRYIVKGVSRVKQNLCRFNGYIKIDSVVVDNREDSYRSGDDLTPRFTAYAKYEFKEDAAQKGSGVFSGKFWSAIYLYKNKAVCYDDLEWGADSYCNNQFEGTWTSYRTKAKKKANFGDYRIPDSSGLDGGAAEFMPYGGEGWGTYRNMYSNFGEKEISDDLVQAATAEEQREWWKGEKENIVTWKTRKTKGEPCSVDIYRNGKFLQTLKTKVDCLYRIKQSDFNYDGFRDILISPEYDSKRFVYLWSPKSGKYAEAPEFEKVDFTDFYERANCVVGIKQVSHHDVKEYIMYKLLDDKFVLYSTLVKRPYDSVYCEQIIYNQKGEVVDRKKNPKYDDLFGYWKSLFSE